MDTDAPAPELFVARDRARRFARYIREALQERRLHYRGAEVGMTSLVDEAGEALEAVVEDLKATIADILAARIRDRERGYMEMPLVVMAERLLEQVDLARRLDRAREQGGLPRRDAGVAVIALLDDALQRIDAFCGAYDEKRPLGAARQTDLAHGLELIERHLAWARMLSDPKRAPEPAFDQVPPDIESEPHGLADLLAAARGALPGAPGPWRVRPAGAGAPLTLSLGEPSPEAQDVPPPERLARAHEVLTYVRPLGLTCQGRPGAPGAGLLSDASAAEAEIEAIEIAIEDGTAGRLAVGMQATAGADAALLPAHEKAVRALLDAPPLPQDGPPPPARLVALMGVLKAIDDALLERVMPRAQRNTAMVAARGLPREKNRKAPLVRNVTVQLQQQFPQLAMHRVEEIAGAVAHEKLAARHMDAGGAAVLIALLGRRWNAGGRDIPDILKLAPLTEADTDALVEELIQLGAVRRDLESGRDVTPQRITRLEQAAMAILGRLGRVEPLPG
ncbi:MAG: hypothetical protein P1V36_08885 [Planctomycetota bacterium]|nr:hypothetical protein [Planctomycetota bacterium]